MIIILSCISQIFLYRIVWFPLNLVVRKVLGYFLMGIPLNLKLAKYLKAINNYNKTNEKYEYININITILSEFIIIIKFIYIGVVLIKL